jgi:hypothetical protein
MAIFPAYAIGGNCAAPHQIGRGCRVGMAPAAIFHRALMHYEDAQFARDA